LKRAETRKLDAEVQAGRVLDDLKVHLSTIRDQLRQSIHDAHMAQNALLKRDADEKAERDEEARAQELEKAAQKKAKAEGERKKKGKAGLPPTERPATGQSTTRKTKEVVRPKTAKGAPIVTPQFDG
jgi:hypothetical protein